MERLPVRTLTDADVERVADLLTDAFAADPTWRWIFGDPTPAPHQRTRVWRVLVGSAVDNGTAREVVGGAVVSIWVPPGSPELSPQREAELDRVTAAVVGAERAALLPAAWDTFAAHRPERPHHYLDFLAVRPDHRGTGLGMALLRQEVADNDAEGLPTYLESSNPRNLARYEANGFGRLQAFALPPDGPTVDGMWHEPATAAAAAV